MPFCVLLQKLTHSTYISWLHQVGCWDGTVAVVRLQPSATPGNGQSTRDMGSQQAQSDSPLQHDMVVLTHFQADPLPIRAIAWCPSQASFNPIATLFKLLWSFLPLHPHAHWQVVVKQADERHQDHRQPVQYRLPRSKSHCCCCWLCWQRLLRAKHEDRQSPCAGMSLQCQNTAVVLHTLRSIHSPMMQVAVRIGKNPCAMCAQACRSPAEQDHNNDLKQA